MIVLDTHVAVWWANGGGRLSEAAVETIERERARPDGCIAISAISAWEMAMLVERGRLVLAVSLETFIETLAAVPRIEFHPVDNAVALEAVRLPGSFHADPADRMIVATARRLRAALVTADGRIRAYPHVEVTW